MATVLAELDTRSTMRWLPEFYARLLTITRLEEQIVNLNLNHNQSVQATALVQGEDCLILPF